MAMMTDEEADALDELLTRTTPRVRAGEGGFFTRQRNLLNALDPVAGVLLVHDHDGSGVERVHIFRGQERRIDQHAR
jgi:hypothetical protein